jgi:hypothetical protein
MNRLASMRVGAVVVSLAMALAGCDCGKVDCAKTPTDPKCVCDNSDLTVAFVAPMEGEMVDQTSNVQVSLSRKGMPVNIGTARLEVRGPGATDFSDKGNGTADGATATFTGVMLAAGENALRATVAEVNCSGGANPKTIVVTAKSTVTPPPVIVSCTFPQDSNGDGTLNAAELPAGTQVSVRVLTTNGAGATFSAPGSNPAMAPIMNETATIAVPGPTADGTFSVTGTVARGTGMPTCSPMIRVQRTAGCAVENTTSQAPRGPMDDADAAAAGFQVRASATRVTGMAATSTLRMGNETRTINLNSMASASADFTVASMGTQNYMVTLEASDSAGNPCMVTNATRAIPVDFDAPMFTILTPTAMADGGRPTVTASQVTVGVSVSSGNNGATACVFRVQGATRVQADCETVVNDAASLIVPLSADGTYTLEVQLTDLAGNIGTRSVEIDVVLSGCGLSFTRPSLCPALITSSQVSTGDFTFQTQSKASCAGQPARLFRSIVGTDGGIGAAVQVSSGQVAGTGQSSFTANVTSGDYVFRAEVDNLGDGGIELAHCDVTIDLDGPAITNPTLSGGLTRFSINASQDSDPSLAGAQRALAFNARVPQNGRVDVCTTQAVDPVSMQARQTTPECGAGWFLLQGSVSSPLGGFTFPSGSYSIKVVVVGGGTTVASAELPLLVDVVRPCLSLNSIRFPQDVNSDARLNSMELASAAAQLDFQLDPACGDANLASLAAMNPVLVREITAGMPGAFLNAQSDVSFAAGRVVVNLTQGVANERDYSFFVELTDTAGNRSLFSGVMDRAVASVRIDRVAPSCTVVSPTRTTLNRADLQAATNLNAVIGTSADVGTMGVTSTLLGPQSITRSGGPMGPANEASLTFTGLSGTNTWTLNATCSDASGNTTSIAPRALTIDLDAPTCAITSPTAGTYADLNLSTSVAVSGADNQMVTISTTPGGSRGTLTVVAGVATGSILYSLGSQDITASVSDAAGNACVTAPVIVTINTSDCVLAITNAISNPSGLWFSRSNTGMLVGTGLSTAGTATISAQTSNCTAGRTLTLQRTSPVGTPITTTDVAGVATFPNVTLTNLDTWTVSVPNGARPATVVTFRVDLDAPAFGVAPGQVGFVRINGTLVAPATPTFFVASADNRNVDTGTTGYFADLGGAAGSQTNLVIDNTDAFHFGLGGDVRVTFKGMTIGTQSVTSSGQTISFTGPSALQLPQNDSGPLVVRVSDSAGNFNEWTSTATIDVESPSAPPGFSQSVTNSRRGEVTLAWDPSFDDSVMGSGPCEYEVGWTTSSVPGNGGLATNALYCPPSTRTSSRCAPSTRSATTRLSAVPPRPLFRTRGLKSPSRIRAPIRRLLSTTSVSTSRPKRA